MRLGARGLRSALAVSCVAACAAVTGGERATPASPKVTAESASTASGIQGDVVAWPSCAVERADRPCDLRPVAAQVVLRWLSGDTAAKVVTDAAGRFRVKLAPGEYLIMAEASGARCEPLRVSVPAGSFESVRLLCDLGIR